MFLSVYLCFVGWFLIMMGFLGCSLSFIVVENIVMNKGNMGKLNDFFEFGKIFCGC